MKTMSINEEQMSYLLKQFLSQYQGNFSHVTFDPVEGKNGFMVNFHLGEIERKSEPEKHRPQPSPQPSVDFDLLNPLSPISIFHDFGSGGGGFGGFGGGSSGGGGASGGW